MSEYQCRICGSRDHSLILDYGKVALADSFLSSLEEAVGEARYQLTLVFCQSCAHVQIKEILDPSILFSDYVWETGIPASIRAYCSSFADSVQARAKISAHASVVEIASNDGTMLREWKRRQHRVLGVDPARNIAKKASENGIPTIADFFGMKVAGEILHSQGAADLIIARNVLAHVADLHGLADGVRTLLSPDGVAVIEVPHLLTTFEELQYDQVFHEHIGYHSLDSIVRLFGRYGLRVVDAEQVWIHGGSLRAYLAHEASVRRPASDVARVLEVEKSSGILSQAGWETFAARVLKQKRLLRDELERAKLNGLVTVGYGASGKGQSLIQFCELDSTLVKYIADKSSMKIGKWAPGSHIPIVSPETMRSDRVDIVVLFAWNFATEIVEQESAMRSGGARFLHPLPEPHFL
ncbi:MAG: methyltransferase [Polyangiaceae bacterium]